MKKKLIAFMLLALSGISLNAYSQTDEEIVRGLLGKNLYKANHILDSLGVWYYHHFHENKIVSGQETRPKIYSISNGEGSVKVYIFKVHPDKKYIDEITINFRHDSKEQVEDLKKMWTPDEYHVGTYSTDLTFKIRR